MGNPQVLIVEDDEAIASQLQKQLQQLGIGVLALASSGEEVLEMAFEAKPDLVLMGMRLAGKLNGMQAARLVKERFDLPVIFLVTRLDEVTIPHAQLTQPYGYLVEPFQAQNLRSSIEVALYKQVIEHQVNEQLENNARRLAALSRMGQIVTSSLDLPEVLHRVTREAQSLLGVDKISILIKENEYELAFAAVSDEGAQHLLGMRISARVGAAGEVIGSGRPVFINHESEQARIYRLVDSISGFHTQSLLAVPLALENTIIGVVEAVDTRLGAFTRDDLHMLEGVANWAAIAIANARQYHTIQQRLQESEAIAEIGRSLLGTLSLGSVLQMIVDSAQQLIPNVDRAVIHLLDPESHTLEMAAATGLEDLEGPFFAIQPGEGVAGKVLAEGRTLNIADTQTDPIYLPLGAKNPEGSLLVAPLPFSTLSAAAEVGADLKPAPAADRGQLLGTISVRSSVIAAFTSDHERLLTILGVQAALAINNARLFEAERESRRLAEGLLQQEKATRAQLVQSEKLAALGRIVASVAHELNNPLQAIQNAIYLVRMEAGLSSQTQEDLRVALNETERMADLIARLRETYRPAMGEEFQAQAINNLVEEVQKLLATHMRHKNIQFRFHPGPDLPPVRMIRDQMRQVILNISLNAVEAMSAENASQDNSPGGELTVRTEYQAQRRAILLTFQDNGPGIPAEVLDNIFDPFFTTKEGGTGLGLAITYDIVQRHQGHIEVVSPERSDGAGTTFKIWLPAEEPDTPKVAARDTHSRPARRGSG